VDRIPRPGSGDELVEELASLWGVETAYRDSAGRPRYSPLDAVMQVLGILHARSDVGPWPGPVEGKSLTKRDLRWLHEALHQRRKQLDRRLVAPVTVAWDGWLDEVDLLRPVGKRASGVGDPDGLAASIDALAEARVMIGLEVWEEQGQEWLTRDALSSTRKSRRRGTGVVYRLPFGYHRLRMELAGRAEESLVISAPRSCWNPEEARRDWGLFVPTYALRSQRDRGAGDLADLEEVMRHVTSLGGKAVSTLPLLAAYLDSPFEPSPYSPVSRLFWNEFYLSVEQTQEWTACPKARRIWESEGARETSSGPDRRSLVDYATVAALKRRTVGELARHYFREAGDDRRAALDEYLQLRPDALRYAAFRARVEAKGEDWRSWQRPWGASEEWQVTLEQLDESGRYHLYCQWQMDEQLTRLSRRETGRKDEVGRVAPAGLLLDVPVGVHPGGYDTWRWQDLFAEGVSVGAPPDAFFAQGQCWNSPPLHPEQCRERGHQYWRQVLGHHMRHAQLLRLDHVMSLHRLFWVPEGRSPGDGVYVKYPAEELYAVLCLESDRHQTQVVGEDLGTVPPGVRTDMRRHGLLSTWVLRGALRPRSTEVVGPAPKRALAALGTHDMFPWAGFMRGEDIRVRVQTGQLAVGEESRAMVRRRRLITRLSLFLLGKSEHTTKELLAACLRYLGESRAELVMMDLSELLLETEPHNMPGTGSEQGNWRRRLPCTTEEAKEAIEEAALWISRGGQEQWSTR